MDEHDPFAGIIQIKFDRMISERALVSPHRPISSAHTGMKVTVDEADTETRARTPVHASDDLPEGA